MALFSDALCRFGFLQENYRPARKNQPGAGRNSEASSCVIRNALRASAGSRSAKRAKMSRVALPKRAAKVAAGNRQAEMGVVIGRCFL